MGLRLYIISIVTLLMLLIQLNEAYPQEQEERLIQFSGMVQDFYGKPLEYTHITIHNRHAGTITDNKGMFSFITSPRDTIIFSRIGYKKLVLMFPDTITEAHFDADVFMEADTIQIEEVKIYPWKTYEEFKQALVKLNLENKDIENAKRNIAYIQAYIYLDNTPVPNASFRQVMQERYDRTLIKGELVPRNALLDPIAWAKFIAAIKNGEYSKNKKK